MIEGKVGEGSCGAVGLNGGLREGVLEGVGAGYGVLVTVGLAWARCDYGWGRGGGEDGGEAAELVVLHGTGEGVGWWGLWVARRKGCVDRTLGSVSGVGLDGWASIEEGRRCTIGVTGGEAAEFVRRVVSGRGDMTLRAKEGDGGFGWGCGSEWCVECGGRGRMATVVLRGGYGLCGVAGWVRGGGVWEVAWS
ncbi:hypothetical protein Tco_0440083 [Tanacetum coccineum]